MRKRILSSILVLLFLLCAVSCSGGDQGNVIGLMYHHLTENPDEISAWVTTPEEFRQNLTDILALGYDPLSLEDYIAENYDPAAYYFIVTFDDGYRSNLTLAEPVLREMGIPAAIFAVTAYMGTPHYMTWEDLEAAQASDVFTVYSHTHTHLSATDVTVEEFLADEDTARQELSAHLGEGKYNVLSYPNGAFTKESMKELTRRGYDLFVIQDRPASYRENRHGRILLRVNVPGEGADMKEIVNFHRKRCGIREIP